jgi:ATP-dependent phosphoenolpyruvate carboxykinase
LCENARAIYKYFGFTVLTALPGVPTEILNPVNSWKDKDEFDKTARAGRLCPALLAV